ncbi:MAG TPA: heme-binding protein [Candidatus Avamphibacillus intestinigallinarum]|nr:heme-binding protein [Candidatus Avamphibacillus intestinigallinarum]
MLTELNLEVAKEIIAASEKEAANIGVRMVISIADAGGNLIATHRMDDAWIASVDIATNKAWTAVALKMPTENLEEETVPSGSLYGLNTTNQGRIVVFGGGIPLEVDGKVVGAIGVSGSTVSDDVKVAKAGAQAFNT